MTEPNMKKTLQLVLADGLVIKGQGLLETDQVITGEVVFSTASTGYTEILTDPSYYGQIVVLAHPEIGNYGVHFDDFQSSAIKVKALLVRNLSLFSSSFKTQMTLADWLMREQIPLMFGIDTRAIIAHLREAGSVMGAMSASSTASLPELLHKAKSVESMEGLRLSPFVSVSKPTIIKNESFEKKFLLAVIDFGIKRSILSHLSALGAESILLPPDTTAEEIWALNPDGLLLSNGPGDPKTEKTAIATVKALLSKLPIFGICLGHQILALALGYDTYKLRFGHRGSNQAVKTKNGILTTAQNHGFAVRTRDDSFENELLNITDRTNEGIFHKDLFAFSVQFHPEGAPGPHDAAFYFKEFLSLIDKFKEKSLTPKAFSPAQAFEAS